MKGICLLMTQVQRLPVHTPYVPLGIIMAYHFFLGNTSPGCCVCLCLVKVELLQNFSAHFMHSYGCLLSCTLARCSCNELYLTKCIHICQIHILLFHWFFHISSSCGLLNHGIWCNFSNMCCSSIYFSLFLLLVLVMLLICHLFSFSSFVVGVIEVQFVMMDYRMMSWVDSIVLDEKFPSLWWESSKCKEWKENNKSLSLRSFILAEHLARRKVLPSNSK